MTWAAPRWTCTGDQCLSGWASEASRWRRTSGRSVGACSSGLTTQSPRRIASFESRGPARLSAQRSPARPTSAARFWACSERTRASSPDGVSSSRSSTLISPAWTVPVTTTPAPVRTKQRSTARRAKPVAPLPLSPSASSLVLSSSTPCPVSADTGTISAPLSEVVGEQRLDLGHALQDLVVVGQVGLGEGHDAAVEAQQVDDLQMLDRLRLDAFRRRHDQQRGIDAGGAGQHVVHEALVARHVDEAELPAVAQVAVGVAEIDGDAARLLFLQAIGVDAGQRFDQRGLAVIDMACGADDHAAPSLSSCATNAASSSRVRRSK